MKYYICNFSRDWADEFDVKGSRLFTEDEKNTFEQEFENDPDREISAGFGTNEGWEEETLEEWKNSYKFVEITKSTYDELKAKFKYGFGTFIDVTEE